MSFQNPYQFPASRSPDNGRVDGQDPSLHPSPPEIGDLYGDEAHRGYQDASFVPPRSDAFGDPGYPEPVTGGAPISQEKRRFISSGYAVSRILTFLTE